MASTSESSVLLCNYCDLRCYDRLVLLKHMRDTHEKDGNFSVVCDLCGRTYKKWNSLKKHLHRDHNGEYIPV